MPKGQRANKEQKKQSKAKLAAKSTVPAPEVRPTVVTVVPDKGKKKNAP